MNDYHQPDFYRFNQDSIKLVNWVRAKLTRAESILDLGAGSGVIGIELAKNLNATVLDLLEVQTEYLPFLERNISEQLPVEIKSKIIQSSFGEWKPTKKYDLVVCNPPYYLPGRGEPSKDQRRNVSRSFVMDNWEILLKKMEDSIAPQGRAFIVVKEDPKVISEIKRHTNLDLNVSLENKLAFIELSRLNID